MAIFSEYYAFYAREKGLSRLVLRELTFFSEGNEGQKVVGHRARFMEAIGAQLRAAIANREIVVNEPIAIGQIVFAIYAWEVRHWLAVDTTSVARGLTELRALLALQISGFKEQ